MYMPVGTVDGIAYVDMYISPSTGRIVTPLHFDAMRVRGMYVIDFKTVDNAGIPTFSNGVTCCVTC